MEKDKYSVIFYKDKRGKVPIAEYMDKLAIANSKDTQIKYRKIRSYIKLLKIYGTSAGEPYMKHLVGDIWELRPLKDRILFAAFDKNSFILLHCFRKETQKPQLEKYYRQKGILKTTRRGYKMKKNVSSVGMTWEEFEEKYYTPEEIAESDAEVAIISELIKARNEGKISQKQLEELSGVRQPIIARMEKGHTDPRLSTVLKVLASLGKTLVVAPLEIKKTSK